MDISSTIHRLIESMIGRQLLWRISRKFYLLSRRDGSLDFEHNGEREVTERLVDYVRKEERPLVVLDVGCNHGDWLAMIAEASRGRLHSRTIAHAFEPNPALADKIEEMVPQVQDCMDLKIVRAAVSNRPGKTSFILASGQGVHHLATENFAEEGARIEVDVVTLDEFCERAGLPAIDMIKIDVEGFDPLVIQGARGLLSDERVSVIQFEYGNLYLRTRTYLFDVFKQVEHLPYRVGKVTKHGIELFDRWHPDLERFLAANYVIVHERIQKDMKARLVRYDNTNTYA